MNLKQTYKPKVELKVNKILTWKDALKIDRRRQDFPGSGNYEELNFYIDSCQVE